ncbi:MAG: hypothetical protein ACRBEE_15695 [Arenicella sp.]
MYRTLIISLLIFLVACSGSSYDDYLGYWSKPGRSNNKIIEIKRVNGNYILDENAFAEPRRGNGDIVLIKKDGVLAIEYGYSLALSEDKNELIVSGIGSGKRISSDQFDELNRLEQKKIADSNKCKELRHQANKENPLASSGMILFGENEVKAKETRNKYQNKATEAGLIDCKI